MRGVFLSRQLAALLGTLVVVGLFLPQAASAQRRAQKAQPTPLPFSIPGFPGGANGLPGRFPPEGFSPEKFFEQFVQPPGEENAADDETLDRIEFSVEEEARLGSAQLEAFRQDMKRQKIKLLEKGKDVSYIARLASQIHPLMKQAKRYKQIRVYLADTDTTDAYTLPGGHLIVGRGMLEVAGSEAALVAVLGHELSHLDRGHLVRQAKRLKLAEKSLKPGTRGFSLDDFMKSTGTMMQLTRRPFGPREELDADQDGITWAFQLGYDPRELAVLFHRLAERDMDKPANFMPAFFRTHPLHAEREEAVRMTYEELQRMDPRSDLYVGRENLVRRVTRDERRFE